MRRRLLVNDSSKRSEYTGSDVEGSVKLDTDLTDVNIGSNKNKKQAKDIDN
jgi:hypothetical protein